METDTRDKDRATDGKERVMTLGMIFLILAVITADSENLIVPLVLLAISAILLWPYLDFNKERREEDV